MRSNLFLILFSLISSSLFCQSNWKLEVEKNDVKVYVGEAEGSKLKPFKAEVVMNASSEVIFNTLKDHKNMKNWSHDCIESKRLTFVTAR